MAFEDLQRLVDRGPADAKRIRKLLRRNMIARRKPQIVQVLHDLARQKTGQTTLGQIRRCLDCFFHFFIYCLCHFPGGCMQSFNPSWGHSILGSSTSWCTASF